MGIRKVSLINVIVCLLIVLGVSIGAASCATPASPDTIKLVFSTYPGPDYAMCKLIMVPWLDYIERESNGRVQFERYWANSLVGQKDHYKAVQSGTADVILTAHAYAAEMPAVNSDAVPARYPTFACKVNVSNDLYPEFQENFNNTGGQFMYIIITSAYDVWTKDSFVQTAEDWHGKRVHGGGRLANVTQALGGTPVNVPTVETQMALQKNTLDVVPLGRASALSVGLHEVATHMTTNCQYWFGHAPIVMNLQKWQSLPKDIQKIFQSANEQAREWNIDGFNREDAEAMEVFKQSGVQIYELPLDELERWNKIVLDKVKDQWDEGMIKHGVDVDKAWKLENKLYEKYKDLK